MRQMRTEVKDEMARLAAERDQRLPSETTDGAEPVALAGSDIPNANGKAHAE